MLGRGKPRGHLSKRNGNLSSLLVSNAEHSVDKRHNLQEHSLMPGTEGCNAYSLATRRGDRHQIEVLWGAGHRQSALLKKMMKEQQWGDRAQEPSRATERYTPDRGHRMNRRSPRGAGTSHHLVRIGGQDADEGTDSDGAGYGMSMAHQRGPRGLDGSGIPHEGQQLRNGRKDDAPSGTLCFTTSVVLMRYQCSWNDLIRWCVPIAHQNCPLMGTQKHPVWLNTGYRCSV